MGDNKPSYSSTHSHPSHIDIPPPNDDGPQLDDGLSPIGPSGTRPPPSRGILKNPLRRSSQSQTPISDDNVTELSPATDAQRQADQ